MKEESRTIDYKGIKIKIIKPEKGDCIFEYVPSFGNTTLVQMFCDDDSERLLDKFYLNLEYRGLIKNSKQLEH